MPYCSVHIRTQTSTFRNPEFQNYHKSFLLPPPTTIVGLAGAALGLSPKASQDFFDGNNFEMGVSGISLGKTDDLWKYRTLDEKKPSSVLTREILYDNDFMIVFGHSDENKIQQIKAAFESPFYAPVLGSSDSIAKIVSVSVIQDVTLKNELSNCLWEGNIVRETIQAMEDHDDTFEIFFSYKESVVFDLPVRFQYTSDYSMRRVSNRKAFTFIGNKMKLPEAVRGIEYAGYFAPLFKY